MLAGVSNALTGSESTRASIGQAHFGGFGHRLPVDWASTENAIESVLHVMKDMLVVIDDYAPNADKTSRHELVRKVQRIIRTLGNRSARSRLDKSLKKRPDRAPRAAVLTTGEELPPGGSIVARTFVVHADDPKPYIEAISEMQREAERLPIAMRAYIEYVIANWTALNATLLGRRHQYRDLLRGVGRHPRHPGNVGALLVAIDVFADFGVSINAITADEATGFRQRAWDALTYVAPIPAASGSGASVSGASGTLAPRQDVAQEFLDAVRALVRDQKARVLGLADARGFAERPEDVIGYLDDEYVYLLPEPTHSTLRTKSRAKALAIALREAGVLTCDTDNRPAARESTPWGRDRVYRIALSIWTGPSGPSA